MAKVNFKRGVKANYTTDTNSIYFSTNTDSKGRFPLYFNGNNYNEGLNIITCDWTSTDDFVTEATKVLTDAQVTSYKAADAINLSASTSGYVMCYRDWEASNSKIIFIGIYLKNSIEYKYILTLDIANKKLLCNKVQSISKSDIPTIDSAISSTSTNPVQNKVIYTALSKKANSGAENTVSVSGDLSDQDYTGTYPIIIGSEEGTQDMYSYTGSVKVAPIAVEYEGNSGLANIVATDGTIVSLNGFQSLTTNGTTYNATQIQTSTTTLTFGKTSGTIAITSDLEGKVSTSGDTMTGTLVINNKGVSDSGGMQVIDTSKGGITFIDPQASTGTKQVLNMTYGGGSLYISDDSPEGTAKIKFTTDDTPTANSVSIVTSGNLYNALNSSTLTAKILDSVNRSSEISTVTPNYYTTTSIPQGMSIDMLNGKVPLFGKSNDGQYKGIISVRFQQGGSGKSEYYGGTPSLQLAVRGDQFYYRTADTSGSSWKAWKLIAGEPIVETVSTMVDMTVYPNKYYYCASAIDEVSISSVYLSDGTSSDSFTSGADDTVCEYIFDFIAASGFSLSFPEDVVWSSTPSFTEGKRYLISVVNNLAVWAEFDV